MTKGNCDLPEWLGIYFQNCSGSYSIIEEENRNFKYGWVPLNFNDNKPDPGFAYNNSIELMTQPKQEFLGYYGGGGYVIDFERDAETTKEFIDYLIKNNWVDEQTRAIFIEFLIYNPNTNLFTYSTSVVEFFSGGGTLTTPRFYSMKLNPYNGSNGLIIGIMQGITCIFVLYFILTEGRDALSQGVHYFKVIFINIITLNYQLNN